jgi:benzodiazapine receptor
VKPNSFLKLIVAIVVSGLAGGIGSIFTISAIPTWYATLAKPALNPPSWIFGPVWTTLYLLMGIAAFLVWKKGWDRKDVRKALAVFLLQLVLNAAWSIIFFGLHSPFWAFVDISAMWLAIDLDDGLVLQDLKAGDVAASAVHPLGQLCRISQLFHSDAELSGSVMSHELMRLRDVASRAI